MAKASKKGVKRATLTVNIPEELRLAPMRYSGTLGVFGIGGPIPQKPLQKQGFPPGDPVPDIPEATTAQYLKLIANGSVHGITATESEIAADTADSDNG